MTVIAAVVTDTHAWMGSDSMVTAPGCRKNFRAMKHFSRGEWLVGVSGTAAVWRATQHAVEWPDTHESLDAEAWYVAMAVRNAMEEHVPSDEGRWDANWLIARPGALIVLDTRCSYETIRLHEGRAYWGIGTGGDCALGALHATFATCDYFVPDTALRRAVEAAIAIDRDCGGQANISSIPEPEPASPEVR